MTPQEDSYSTRKRSDDAASGPICGERLEKARRARGISLREIAKELHLDEPKVRALEENRFEVLGAPVFAKGHLRKYAELVGVDIDDVLSDYYRLNRSAGAPPVVGPRRKVRREISFGPWIATIAVALLVGAAVWWWWNLQPPTSRVTVQPSAPVEAEPPAEVAADNGRTAPPVEDTTIVDEPAEDDVPSSDPVLEAEPDLAAPTESEVVTPSVQLELAFTGDCWTEVSDATGRRLFFDLGSAGRTVTLTGVEPLGVLLGNSSNVNIRVNGFDYSIPPSNRRGNTARLTIYGQ